MKGKDDRPSLAVGGVVNPGTVDNCCRPAESIKLYFETARVAYQAIKLPACVNPATRYAPNLPGEFLRGFEKQENDDRSPACASVETRLINKVGIPM